MNMITREKVKEEIDKLPDNFIEDIYLYMLFLETKKERERLTRHFQGMSEPSFRAVWDNEEDAVYDKL
jgi:hypothetical protein